VNWKTIRVLKKNSGLNDDERYYRIARLKFDNNKPYALQISHIPARYFASQLTIKNSALSSIYEAFKVNNGLDMYTMPYRQTICALTDAAPEVLQHLELHGSPARYHDETLYPRRARSGD
jgi:DNA-binding GntR family transcriptional regulator